MSFTKEETEILARAKKLIEIMSGETHEGQIKTGRVINHLLEQVFNFYNKEGSKIGTMDYMRLKMIPEYYQVKYSAANGCVVTTEWAGIESKRILKLKGGVRRIFRSEIIYDESRVKVCHGVDVQDALRFHSQLVKRSYKGKPGEIEFDGIGDHSIDELFNRNDVPVFKEIREKYEEDGSQGDMHIKYNNLKK